MSCAQNFRMFEEEFTPTPDQEKGQQQIEEKLPNIDVILNKYLNNQQLTDVELQQISEYDRFIHEQIVQKNNKKKKRPDEFQKIFYKKAFKFAQKKYFAKNKKHKSRRMSQFYHYHFDKVATSIKIPIINFYHPDKKTRPGLKSAQKSFNSSYIRLILRSASFKQMVVEYHNIFVNQCLKERDKKMIAFSRSLLRVIQKNKNDRSAVIRYLQSSQCKIPWTNQEINEAWKRAESQLQGEFNTTEENVNNADTGQFSHVHLQQESICSEIQEDVDEQSAEKKDYDGLMEEEEILGWKDDLTEQRRLELDSGFEFL